MNVSAIDQPRNSVTVISQPEGFHFEDHWYDLASDDHFWMQWRVKTFVRQLKDCSIRCDEALSGLEVGCGQGILRRQMEERTDWVIDGADLDLRGLSAGAPGRGRLFLYNILEKHPSFAEKYDFLVIFDVLEHILEPSSFIDACLFHLKKGGCVFVNVPALPSMMSRYDTAMGHQRRYNRRMLRAQFAPFGVREVDMRYWGVLLLPALLARKVWMALQRPSVHVVDQGFRPPNELAHAMLRGLMRLEDRLIHSPWIGASLMAVFKK